jgi:hypothetical protein
MDDRYEPVSDFLKAIIADKVPLSGSPTADHNLCRLIAMTRDDDCSNRDWATMLLAQEEADTPAIRTALLAAVEDDDDVVRAEALLGIARRDPQLALPYALKALSAESACMAVFEAATLIADPALVESLRAWTEPSGNQLLDRYAADALLACETRQASG